MSPHTFVIQALRLGDVTMHQLGRFPLADIARSRFRIGKVKTNTTWHGPEQMMWMDVQRLCLAAGSLNFANLSQSRKGKVLCGFLYITALLQKSPLRFDIQPQVLP